MDNQDIQNIKVKRTKEDIRLYNSYIIHMLEKMMSIINIMLKKYHSYEYYQNA